MPGRHGTGNQCPFQFSPGHEDQVDSYELLAASIAAPEVGQFATHGSMRSSRPRSKPAPIGIVTLVVTWMRLITITIELRGVYSRRRPGRDLAIEVEDRREQRW